MKTIVLSLILTASGVWGWSQILPLRNYTTEDGLASSQVNAIIQDRDRYMWFGCTGGVSRFNGLSFQTYRTTEGLPHESCMDMFVDQNGRVWAVTMAGLARYEEQTDRFVPVGPDFEIADAVPLGDDILAIVKGRGLFRISPDGNWTAFQHGQETLATGFVALSNIGSHVYAGHETDGIYRLDGDVRLLTAITGITDLSVSRESLLVLTGNRVFKWRTESGRLVPLTIDLGNRALVRCAGFGRDRNLWVGTNTGLIRAGDDQVERFGEASGIPGVPVWTLRLDEDGILWLGTNHGVAKLTSQDLLVYDSLAGRKATSVISFLDDPDTGQMLIGSTAGLFIRSKAGRIRQSSHQYFQQYPPWAMIRDKTGTLWVGTEGGGLAQVNGSTLKLFTRAGGSLPGDNVTDLAQLPDGTLAVACKEGLAFYDGRDWTLHTVNSGLPAPYIRCLQVQPDGTLLMGTIGGGLIRYRDGSFATLTANDPKLQAIYDIVYLKDRLWLATNYGIAAWRENNVTFYGREAGLPNASTTTLLPVGDFLWVGTDGGAALFNTAVNRVVRILTRDEGLPGNEFTTHNALAMDQNGDAWFGVFGGAAQLFQEQGPVFESEGTPTIRVRELEYRDGAREIRKAIENGRQIELPYGSRSLTIRFDVIWFRNENSIHIRTRMNGLEDGWYDLSNRRELEARYTTMPPGDYTFQVQVSSFATDADQMESELLRIRVPRPFWMKPGMWGLGILLLLIIIHTVVRLRIRHLKKEREILNRKVREQTRKLEETNAILAQKNIALQELAETDYLTGLYNRRHFISALRRHIQLARRGEQEELALILLDLDHFKEVNDKHGHDTGDLALKQFAEILRSICRNTDTPARFGGEEFIVLLPKTDSSGASTLAEKIRATVAKQDFGQPEEPVHITISAGVSQLNSNADNMYAAEQMMIKEADIALYRAKSDGRNRVKIES